MDLTTPALLFPAISLLLLAYTNRFLVLAQLIRQLHERRRSDVQDVTARQIANLRKRIGLIKAMQAYGVTSFILCALSMFFIFTNQGRIAEISFGLSLFVLVLSLGYSLYEIAISTDAIKIELEDLEKKQKDL
ncbi:II family cellulose-binding protein [Geoalkalibacter ferrihydriticus DSM 17813]|uniref:II family cellulose-binding protein n=1 Tax=Geoalkalibacter ferrihydriticus DSM 17813 TaxID=1121915 RepID=A0A0C2HKY2_9BACT|nr:II family cellulose-binding protein [Geoalkalibacter ferrihydriticus DSM 17813]